MNQKLRNNPETIREFLADEAKFPEWADYFTFCRLLETGLRKEALTKLNKFISTQATNCFDQRRQFVSWLHHRVENIDRQYKLFPHTIQKRLIEPTLLQSIEREPNSAEPYCWLGTFAHLKKAVSIEPDNEIVVFRFVRCLVAGIGYNTHELPIGYLGDDPLEDLTDLATAESLLPIIRDTEQRSQFAARITKEKTVLNDYLRDRKARN